MNEYVIDFWSIEKLLNMRTQNCQGKGFKIPLCERWIISFSKANIKLLWMREWTETFASVSFLYPLKWHKLLKEQE